MPTGADANAPIEADDAAWVRVDTPLAPAALLDFCGDVERLLRINPMLEFSEFTRIGPDHYRMRARNLSNQGTLDTDVRVTRSATAIEIRFDQGLKRRTVIRAEPGGADGATLVIADDYSGWSEEERRDRAAEIDHSLVQWGHYLRDYLLLWRRWSWCAPWRWYMRRVWQPMTASSRRIVYMLLWITVVEIIGVLIVVAVFATGLDGAIKDWLN